MKQDPDRIGKVLNRNPDCICNNGNYIISILGKILKPESTNPNFKKMYVQFLKKESFPKKGQSFKILSIFIHAFLVNEIYIQL